MAENRPIYPFGDGGPAFPEQWTRHNEEWVPVAAFGAERGMSLRDYFIAHAPAEPQPWFQPAMPTERPQLPKFPEKYTGDQRQGDYVREYGDVMKPEDIRSPELRQYAEETRAVRRAIAEWDVQAQRQFYVQWPAAWADAMLKARQP